MSERDYDELSPSRLNKEFVLQFMLLGGKKSDVQEGRTLAELEGRQVKEGKLASILDKSALTEGCREFFAERFHEYLEAGFAKQSAEDTRFSELLGLVSASETGIFDPENAQHIEEIAFELHVAKLADISASRQFAHRRRNLPSFADREMSMEVDRRSQHALRWRGQFVDKYGAELLVKNPING